MNSHVLRIASISSICIALLAPFSTSGAQGPASPQPPEGSAEVLELQSAPLQAPTVASIWPDSGPNTGIVHITNLAGDNFQSGAVVKLTKAGQPDINAVPGTVTVVSPSRITCDFDLTGAATGPRDVVVINPDAQEGRRPNGFTVTGTTYLHLPVVLSSWRYLPEPTTPNDAKYATYQWNLPQIEAPYAWAVSTGSDDVVIAVLDTGVDLTHPDLEGKLVAGRDFVNGDSDASDDHGHGTHVAGIAAARTNNSQGVAGVSWGGKIMPVKVLDYLGRGSHLEIADGITWAADQGAEVINLSLGGEDSSSTLQDAVNYAHSRGALIVAAAGNDYEEGNPVIYPAAYPNVLAVAATDDQDGHASYSETGDYVDVAAPGGDPSSSLDPDPDHWIMSTYWRGAGKGDYYQVVGTSPAAPHVSGLAALVWSVNPSLSNDQVEQVIKNTAVDLGQPGRDDVFGYGRIDAYAALASAPYATAASSVPSADRLRPEPEVSRGSSAAASGDFEPGVILVKFRDSAQEAGVASVLSQYPVRATGQIAALGVLRLSVPEGQEVELSQQLGQDASVEYAEPNYIARGF